MAEEILIKKYLYAVYIFIYQLVNYLIMKK